MDIWKVPLKISDRRTAIVGLRAANAAAAEIESDELRPRRDACALQKRSDEEAQDVRDVDAGGQAAVARGTPGMSKRSGRSSMESKHWRS